MEKEQFNQWIDEYASNNQYDVSKVPAHTHNGTDSLLIDFSNIQNVTSFRDSSYTQKGIVEFLTDAATSGIVIASGIAYVNMGTGANQIVQLDASSKLPAVDGSQLTNLPASFSGKIKLSTVFETTARFTKTVTDSGTGSFGINGAGLATGGGTQGSSDLKMAINIAGGNAYLGNPTFSTICEYTDPGVSGTSTSFIGLGSLTVATAGITFTDRHIGFKTVGLKLYATQADGTTENQSAQLTTITSTDVYDLIFIVNSTTSVSYYYRVNGGALSAATVLTTNIPSGTTPTMQFSTSSNSNPNGLTLQLWGASYER